MQNSVLTIILLFTGISIFGQFEDNFDQSDISSWQGDNSNFIVNQDNQLQLNATEAGQSVLYHSVNFADSLIWSFDIRLRFSPSNNNKLTVLLAVDNPDISTANGYILKIGQSGSDDAIDLLKLEDGVTSLIASGTPGLVASSFFINVSIRKGEDDTWILNTTDLNTGTVNSEIDINFSDDIITSQTYFGFLCDYTSSNADNFIFDNIYIDAIRPDTEAPDLLNLVVNDNRQIVLTFNEPLDNASTVNISNYTIEPDNQISAAIFDELEPNKITLDLIEELNSCEQYLLEISNIQDLSGNVISTIQRNISVLERPTIGDLLINEILSNPINNDVDFIEIINVSEKSLQLQNLIIRNETRDDEEKIEFELDLLPGELIVLTSNPTDIRLKYAPPTTSRILEQDLPGFNNTSGNASLIMEDNGTRTIIDSYDYDDDQLSSNLADKNGVSFERISCIEASNDFTNWSSPLIELALATPGYTNTIAIESEEYAIAQIINTNEIEVRFKFEINEVSALNLSNYSLSNFNIVDIIRDGENPKVVVLFLEEDLLSGETYYLTISNLETQCGNALDSQSYDLMLLENAEEGDLLINEILFNPFKDQVDFVEIINVSNKFIRLNNLNILNDDSGNNENLTTNQIIEPNQIFAFTENETIIRNQYLPPVDANIIVQSLPAFNDDEGNCTLRIGAVIGYQTIDAFDYNDDYHFGLITDTEGVSLERISLIGPTNDEANWFSSAEENNYATPGYENSSRQNPEGNTGEQVFLAFKTFSPNGDGDKDVLFLNYNLSQGGYVGNVRVYDDRGRLQNIIANNSLLANQGFFRWDGINLEGQLSPVGMYIIHYEFFNENGDVLAGKHVCVLAQNL